MAVLNALFFGLQAVFLIKAAQAQLVSLQNGAINTDINNVYSNNAVSNNNVYSNNVNEVIYNNSPSYSGNIGNVNDVIPNNNYLSNNYAQNIVNNDLINNNVYNTGYNNDLVSVNLGNSGLISNAIVGNGQSISGLSFGNNEIISNIGYNTPNNVISNIGYNSPNNFVQSNIISNFQPCSGVSSNLNILQNNLGQSNIQGLNIPGSSPILSNIVPNLQVGEMSLSGDLPIGGTIKVCGCMPVYGIVSVDGTVPSGGAAYVNTGCNFASQIVENNCVCGNF